MPTSEKAVVFQRPFIERKGQEPLTRALALNDALDVQVIHAPNVDTFGPVLSAFTKACHQCAPPDPESIMEGHAPLHEIASGTALWQAMETLRFTILIRNCSRVFTHQLVRARVGMTYSQQCFGDTDMRHADILIPGGLEPAPRRMMIHNSLEAKKDYVVMMDRLNVGLQQARYILPHTLATFIYVDASLNALAGLYAKRSCTMTQAWETYLFAEQLKVRMIEAAPYVEPAFLSPCDSGSCYYQKAKETPFAITHFYAPDEKHDTFDWHPYSFVYGINTHRFMATDYNAQATEYYRSMDEIDRRDYGQLAREHDIYGRR